MAAYHKSKLGQFGESLVVDIDGYTYTTAEEWLTVAKIDDISGELSDADYAAEWAQEQAASAVAALAEAEEAVDDWRRS